MAEKDESAVAPPPVLKRYRLETSAQFLRRAAREGDAATVRSLLSEGEAADGAPNRYNTTRLHDAARGGHAAVVTLLLDAGANIDAVDVNGLTALNAAAGHGHLEVVRQLLFRGASVDLPGAASALHNAAAKGHAAVVALLIEHGARVNLDGWTPLMAASRAGYLEIVELLLRNGADLHAGSSDHGTALYLAAGRQEVGSHQLLVEADACLAPLTRSVLLNQPDILHELLNGGADANAVDCHGSTALLWAALCGSSGMVETLLQHEARVDVRGPGDRPPLISAAIRGEAGIVRLLLQHRADPHAQPGRHRWTALLHAASHGGCAECVRLLLEAGAELDTRGLGGVGALNVAAYYGRLEVVQLLLDRGVAVDTRNDRGETPLMNAAEHGCQEVMRLLLTRGADPRATTVEGRSVLAYADYWVPRCGTRELLLDAGAKG